MILGFVDPHFLGQLRHTRWAFDEAFRVLLVDRIHHGLSLREDLGRAVFEHGGGGEPRDALVLVLVVVVLKERATPRERVGVTGKAVGIRWRVFGGLEKRFGKRIVVARPRSTGSA